MLSACHFAEAAPTPESCRHARADWIAAARYLFSARQSAESSNLFRTFRPGCHFRHFATRSARRGLVGLTSDFSLSFLGGFA